MPPNGLRGSHCGAVFNPMANDTGNSGSGPAQVDLPGSFPGWLSSPVSPFRRAGPPPKSNFAVWAGALRSPLALGHVSGGSWAILRARPCRMAVAAGCFLIGQPGGRAGRVWSIARPARLCCAAWIAGGQEGPCAGQEARHQGRRRRPGGALFAENCPRVYVQAEKMRSV